MVSCKRLFSHSLEARGPKSRCPPFHAPSEGSEEEAFPTFLAFGGASILNVLWLDLRHPNLRLHLHVDFSPVYVCVSSLLLVRTAVIKLGPMS